MAGTIVADTLQNGAGTSTSMDNAIYGSAKAWVNFNGTTSSPSTIRASYNVTSVTKSGTGNYTVNFTNAMSDSNYTVSGTARYTTSTNSMYLAIGDSGGGGTYSTSAVKVRSVSFSAGGDYDCDIVNVVIVR